MVKLIEYVINKTRTFDMIVDQLYNTPRLRRYDYILDYFVPTSIEGWDSFFEDIGRYGEDLQGGYAMDITEEVYEQEFDDEFTGEEWQWKKAEEIIDYVVDTIYDILNNDETLQNDLFYSESGTEADINDNDWKDVSDVVKAIKSYTTTYRTAFTDKQAEIIKKHMKKTTIPLYRIEPYLDNVPVGGDTFMFGGERTKGIKSFTEDIYAETMFEMMWKRAEDSINGDGIVIYRTIGDVYSLNIDQLSDYAVDELSCEWEHLVSGEFEVVSISEGYYYDGEFFDGYAYDEGMEHCDFEFIDITYVGIRQIRK